MLAPAQFIPRTAGPPAQGAGGAAVSGENGGGDGASRRADRAFSNLLKHAIRDGTSNQDRVGGGAGDSRGASSSAEASGAARHGGKRGAEREDPRAGDGMGDAGLARIEIAPIGIAPIGIAPIEAAPIEAAPIGISPIEAAPNEIAPIEIAPVLPALPEAPSRPADPAGAVFQEGAVHGSRFPIAPPSLASPSLAPPSLAPRPLGPSSIALSPIASPPVPASPLTPPATSGRGTTDPIAGPASREGVDFAAPAPPRPTTTAEPPGAPNGIPTSPREPAGGHRHAGIRLEVPAPRVDRDPREMPLQPGAPAPPPPPRAAGPRAGSNLGGASEPSSPGKPWDPIAPPAPLSPSLGPAKAGAPDIAARLAFVSAAASSNVSSPAQGAAAARSVASTPRAAAPQGTTSAHGGGPPVAVPDSTGDGGASPAPPAPTQPDPLGGGAASGRAPRTDEPRSEHGPAWSLGPRGTAAPAGFIVRPAHGRPEGGGSSDDAAAAPVRAWFPSGFALRHMHGGLHGRSGEPETVGPIVTDPGTGAGRSAGPRPAPGSAQVGEADATAIRPETGLPKAPVGPARPPVSFAAAVSPGEKALRAAWDESAGNVPSDAAAAPPAAHRADEALRDRGESAHEALIAARRSLGDTSVRDHARAGNGHAARTDGAPQAGTAGAATSSTGAGALAEAAAASADARRGERLAALRAPDMPLPAWGRDARDDSGRRPGVAPTAPAASSASASAPPPRPAPAWADAARGAVEGSAATADPQGLDHGSEAGASRPVTTGTNASAAPAHAGQGGSPHHPVASTTGAGTPAGAATAHAATAQGVAPSLHAQAALQVAEKLAAAGHGATVTIPLDPPELGRVMARFIRRGDLLRVELLADSSEVAGALNRDLARLTASLARDGQPVQVEVQVRTDAGASDARQQHAALAQDAASAGAHGERRGSRTGHAPADDHRSRAAGAGALRTAATGTSAAPLAATGGLDVRA